MKNSSRLLLAALLAIPAIASAQHAALGRWRTVDAQSRIPIDASTVLSTGKAMTGPVDLRNYLTSRPDQFPMTVTKRLMMYALNREIEYFDMPMVREIVKNAADENYTLTAIVEGIVTSDAFRYQGKEESAGQEGAAADTAAVAAKSTEVAAAR